MSVIFMNDGEASLDAITLLGVSVKESENPIGKFGTGAPNAIAVILRHGLRIRIDIGKDSYTFELLPQTIRGEEFHIVGVRENGKKLRKLGFTTELGKFWSLWQAYRELYSNAVDEHHGQVLKLPFSFTKKADAVGQTMIIVNGREFEEVHDNRSEFILSKPNHNLVYANSQVEIYNGESKVLFYRGIKAKELYNPSKFTYNILEGKLTEDRTLEDDYQINVRICRAWRECENKTQLREALAYDTGKFEKSLYWNYALNDQKPLPQSFKEAIKEQRKHTAGVSTAALELFHREVAELSDIYNVVELSQVEKMQYEKALHFLKELNLVPDIKYEVVFVDNLSEADLGQATKDKKIIINKLAFSHGTKILARVIWEEWLHCEHGFSDFTRAFQNHLFDCVMNIGERVVGSPV